MTRRRHRNPRNKRSSKRSTDRKYPRNPLCLLLTYNNNSNTNTKNNMPFFVHHHRIDKYANYVEIELFNLRYANCIRKQKSSSLNRQLRHTLGAAQFMNISSEEPHNSNTWMRHKTTSQK